MGCNSNEKETKSIKSKKLSYLDIENKLELGAYPSFEFIFDL